MEKRYPNRQTGRQTNKNYSAEIKGGEYARSVPVHNIFSQKPRNDRKETNVRKKV